MPDKLSDIKPNGRNPRLIRKERMEKLREYLAEFGDLSGLVVNADGTIISGHQRSQVFKKEKGKLTILERYDPPTADGTTARGFIELKDGSRFVYREVDWPQEKADRATIVANGNFGEWDSDILTNEWAFDIPELREFGVPEFVFGGAEIDGFSGGGDSEPEDNRYSKKIEAPVYEPKNEKPETASLVSQEKTNDLIRAIEQSDISQIDKDFLKTAALRHLVFDYEKIADYYANSTSEVQQLMEDSALVIIDFNKAIEGGYVELMEEISKLYAEEYPEAAYDEA